jgi:hypothetical protein
VVVDDLDVEAITFRPSETDTPLLVDPYAELIRSIARQPFESISRGDSEVDQTLCTVQHAQLPSRPLLNRNRQVRRALPEPDTSINAGSE